MTSKHGNYFPKQRSMKKCGGDKNIHFVELLQKLALGFPWKL